MRFMTMLSAAVVLLMILSLSQVAAQENSEAMTTQAPISLDDAVPAIEVSLDPEPRVIALPSGWYLMELIPGGFLLQHDDGSRARIVQCQQTTYYRVAWRIDYQRDGINYVSANIVRQGSSGGKVNGTRLRVRAPTDCINDEDGEISVRTDGECRVQALAIVAPWPERIQQQLLNELNPVTRHGTRVPQ